MCRVDNLDVSLRFVAMERALEIAKKGFSELALPEKNMQQRRSSMRTLTTLFDRDEKHYISAMLLIAKALKTAQDTRHSIEYKIRHDSKLAEQRLMRGNDDGAYLAMTKVVKVQYEYVHLLRRIAAIKALRQAVRNGIIKSKQVEENLAEIMAVRGAPKPRDFEYDELLEELEEGNFFPVLNAEDGSISFTDSYEYASASMDDTEEEEEEMRRFTTQ